MREPFTSGDDLRLYKYIATYNPQKAGRCGRNLYKTLCEDPLSRWSWSRRHPWQSWRERYVKHQDYFDCKIARWQKKKGIVVEAEGRKRRRDDDNNASTPLKLRKVDVGSRVPSLADMEGKVESPPATHSHGGSDNGPTEIRGGSDAQNRDNEEDNADLDIEHDGTPRRDYHVSNANLLEEEDKGDRGEVSTSLASTKSEKCQLEPRRNHQGETNLRGILGASSTSSSAIPRNLLRSRPLPLNFSRTPVQQSRSDVNIVAHQVSEEVLSVPVQRDPVNTILSQGTQEPTPPTSTVETHSPAPAIPHQDTFSIPAGCDPGSHDGPDGTEAGSLKQPKRRLSTTDTDVESREDADERDSFFGDVTDDEPIAPHSTSFGTRKPRAPPKIVEGAFGNFLFRPTYHSSVRRVRDEETVAGDWPPKRGKQVNQAVKLEPSRATTRAPLANPAHEGDLKSKSKSSRLAPFGSRTQSSSSTEQLLAQHTASYGEKYTHPVVGEAVGPVTNPGGGRKDDQSRERRAGIPGIDPINLGGHHPFSQDVAVTTGFLSQGGDRLTLGSPFKTPAESSVSVRERMPSRPRSRSNLASRNFAKFGMPMASSSEELLRGLDPTLARGISDGRAPVTKPTSFTLPGSSDPGSLTGGPFYPSDQRHHIRRQTFGGYNVRSADKGDLDQSRIAPRRSLPSAIHKLAVPGVHARAGSLSFESTTSSTAMSVADRNLAIELGIDVALRQMADTHGCTKDYARNIWNCIGDFRKTDAVLKFLRGDSSNQVPQIHDFDLDDLADESQSRGRASVDVHAHALPATRGGDIALEEKLQLTIKTGLSIDEGDYLPPESSRAGQFARLERAGRRQEALKREKRRASLGGISPHRVGIVDVGHGESSSASPKPSVRANTEGRSLLAVVEPHFIQGEQQDSIGESKSVDGESPGASSSGQPVWGHRENEMLRSQNVKTLETLVQRMGNAAVRDRVTLADYYTHST